MPDILFIKGLQLLEANKLKTTWTVTSAAELIFKCKKYLTQRKHTAYYIRYKTEISKIVCDVWTKPAKRVQQRLESHSSWYDKK
jgi:hypothetical protein